MQDLPLFSYPSTIAWIDDDKLFLKAVTCMLETNYHLKTFYNPLESLRFFEKYNSLLSAKIFLRGCAEHESYDNLDHMPVDLNMQMFTQLRNHPEKYQEISVVVIDYNMPNMTGIELCGHLQSLPIKKILLTGEVEHPQAVAAFNNGLIDCFIRKDSPNLVAEIQLHLRKLTQQYFIDNTKSFLNHLEADQSLPISDSIFIEFFKNWCHNHNIREHFLIDKQGNFVVADQDGNHFYFIIHTDRTVTAFIELYEENAAAKDLMQAISNRELIPFFGEGREAWQSDVTEWASHFYKPALLEGRETYYWSVIRKCD